MIRSWFQSFWRNARRQPLYTGLNLVGLAIGIACAFLVLNYVCQELGYDKAIPHSGRIVRVGTDFMNMGGFAVSQEQLQTYLEESCPDVERATRFRAAGNLVMEINGKDWQEERFLWVDSSFSQVFQYVFEEGDAHTAMQHEGQVVLTNTLARKYFGEQPALGETILVGEEKNPFIVSGVVRPFAGKTHLPEGVWLPVYDQLRGDDSWTSAAFYNYALMRPGAGAQEMEAFLDQLLRQEIHPRIAPGVSFEEWYNGAMAVRFFVQPLREIYLYSTLQFDLSPGGNPTQVLVLGLIGLFILLMAAVNYVNLTTAAGTLRAREVGVRKVMGAGKRDLVLQFLGETIMLGLMAMLAAAGFSEILVSVLALITGEPFMDTLLSSPGQWLTLLAFTVVVSVLAGAYPAFYLTRFQPVRVLKGEPLVKQRSIVRGVLVVLQFAVAIALLICTLVVFRQLQFMQKGDKGFRHENVLVINLEGLGEQKDAFRTLVDQHAQVLETSVSSRIPAGHTLWQSTYQAEGMEQPLTVAGFPIDEHFLSVMQMRLLDGRNFSGDLASDSTSVILNESAARKLGLDDPVGAVLNGDRRVIGLVANFNFQSFRQEVAPVVFTLDEWAQNLAVKVSGNDLPGLLAYLETSWARFVEDKPPDYYFLDENMARLSEREAILSKAITFFTALAIFIACLGLFGLATFATARRTKEIGVRKVLGASVVQVVHLLSLEFLRPVLVAVLLAAPVAGWLSLRWLRGFAYHIELSWWMFLAPALVVLIIAMLTISYQSVRAAVGDPVDALRTE